MPRLSRTRLAPLVLTALVSVAGLACSEDVVWPIANSADIDADPISSPFGPRDQSGDYDFHAGVDFAVPEGTKVRAIKAGTVEKAVEWDGESGTGTWVLIDHGGGEKSAYLHLSKLKVKDGDNVRAGKVIGRSGSTGNTSPHLHLTYMLGVTGSGADESVAVNPLELLPSSLMGEPEVEWGDDRVVLIMPMQPMSVQAIALEGGGLSRTVDYADILALGNPDRDNQTQDGIRLAVEDLDDGRFELSLRLSPENSAPERVVLTDFEGEVVLDASRP